MQSHTLSLAQKAALLAAGFLVIAPDAAHAAVDGVTPILAQMEFTKIYDGLKSLKKLFMAVAAVACLAFLIAAVIANNRGESDEMKKRLLACVLCGGSAFLSDTIFKFFGFSEVSTL